MFGAIAKSLAVLFVFVAVIAVVYLKTANRPIEWNQRLTMVVRTPNGIVKGGSVISLRSKKVFLSGAGTYGSASSIFNGEASFVEVLPGKYLFATLNDDEASSMAVRLFLQGAEKGKRPDRSLLAKMRGKREVPYYLYSLAYANSTRPPLQVFLTFTDMSDPATFQIVDPSNMSEFFGPNVVLDRIELELTDDPPTKGPIRSIITDSFVRKMKQLEFYKMPQLVERPETVYLDYFGSSHFWRETPAGIR